MLKLLDVPDVFSRLSHKPKWHTYDWGEFELCGPFFSISAVAQPDDSWSIILHMFNSTSENEADYNDQLLGSAKNEAIAKNLCTINYNQILSTLSRANKEDE